jgi:hypothetical protein
LYGEKQLGPKALEPHAIVYPNLHFHNYTTDPIPGEAVFNFIPKTAMDFYHAMAVNDMGSVNELLKSFYLPLIELRNRKAEVTRPEVYLHYGEQLRVGIHLPPRHSDKLRELAATFFDANGVVSYGGTVKRYEIQPDPERLKRFGITLPPAGRPSSPFRYISLVAALR